MADSIKKTVEIAFVGKDELGGVTSDISSDIEDIERSANSSARSLSNMTRNAGNASKDLNSLASAARDAASPMSELETSTSGASNNLESLSSAASNSASGLSELERAAFGVPDHLSRIDVSRINRELREYNEISSESGRLTYQLGGYMSTLGAGMANTGGLPNLTLQVGLFTAAMTAAGIAVETVRSDIESNTTKIGNAFDIPVDKAEEFKEIAKNLFDANFAGDLNEAFEKVTASAKEFGTESVEQIEKIAMSGSKISEVFGADFNDVMGAASVLINTMGMSADEAFDFITTGFHNGLDESGNFLQSIDQTGKKFGEAGVGAQQFYQILKAGSGDAVLTTKEIVKMYTELSKNIKDGSFEAQEALKNMGFFPDKLKQDLLSGKVTVDEVFSSIVKNLNETTSENDKFKLGTALLGDGYKKLGTEATGALTGIGKEVEKLEGAFDKLAPDDSIGNKFQQMWNTIQTSLADHKGFDNLESNFKEIIDSIKESFKHAFDDGVDTSQLTDAIQEVVDEVISLFRDMDIDITSVDGMKNAIDLVDDTLAGFVQVSKGFLEGIEPIIKVVKSLAESFGNLNPEAQAAIGYISGMVLTLTTFGTALSAGGGVLKGLAKLNKEITALSLLKNTGKFIIAFTIGWKVGEVIRDYLDLDEPIQKAIRALDKVINFTGKMGKVDLGDFGKEKKKVDVIDIDYDAMQARLDNWFDEVDSKEVEVKAQITLDEEKTKAAKEQAENLLNIPKQFVELGLDPTEAREKIEYFVDGEKREMLIEVNEDGADDAKKKIETIPTEKMLEIKLKGEIDKEITLIKTQADTLQTAMKLKAELNIAEVQAGAKEMEAAFKATGESVSSLSKSTSDMFSSLVDGWNDLSQIDQWKFMDILEKQQDMTEKAIESQIKLTDAMIEYRKEKMKRLSSGDALIKIDTTGLEPILEMLLVKIVEMVKFKTNQEGLSVLTGL